MYATSHPHRHANDHRGWVRPGGRRGRWLEPFLLRLVAEGDVDGDAETHGGALIAQLDGLCLAPDGVDVGMAYRTLREFESEGLVVSRWVTDSGAPRRVYKLTEAGRQALEEWIAVMWERARLIDAFFGRSERLPGGEGG